MAKPIRVALCDDHSLIRQALKIFIQSHPGLEVTIDTSDYNKLQQALEKKSTEIDVFLLDLDSLAANQNIILQNIIEQRPDCGIVIMSLFHNNTRIGDLFDMGISAFVSKAGNEKDLIDALRVVSRNRIFQNRFYDMAIRCIKADKAIESSKLPSKVEQEILKLLWEDKSNKQIAKALCISLSMLEKLKQALKTKAEARSNLGLIKYALNNGILFNGR